MANVRIIQMCRSDSLYDLNVPKARAVVHTCGVVALAWTAIDGDTLTVCVHTPPYCIVRDKEDTIWLHDRKPHSDDLDSIVWRRADAELEASNG